MDNIHNAQFRGIVEISGTRYAQVEAYTGGEGESTLLAHFIRSSVSLEGFDMPLVVKNNADYEQDWFDNNMHNAFVDITSSTEDHYALKQRLLSLPEIRSELERHL